MSFDKSSGPPPPTPGYAYPPAYGFPPAYPPYGYPPYGSAAPPAPPHEKPSSNIGWAIAAIFTFWPLAIPSFIYANKVDTFWFAGNRAGAEQASRDARTWGLIGVIIGAVLFVLVIIWFVIIFAVIADTAHNLPDPSSYPSAYPS